MTLQEQCEEIIENLDTNKVKQLLTQLNIPYREEDRFLLCETRCHHTDDEEASWKLYYYKDNHFFMCYSSCGGLSIFNFLKNYYQIRNYDFDWYEDIFLVAKNCSLTNSIQDFQIEKVEKKKDRYNKRKLIQLPEYNKGVLGTFTKTYPIEWLKDGISAEAMDKFNILYSINQNKIIIPHLDVNGRLIGIRGRALNQEEVELYGKYMPVMVEKTIYKHKLSQNLYGLYQNKDIIKETGICYVCESEKSVLQCESFSIPNCAVAVCGSNFNIFQLKLLIQTCHPKEIVICFDKEEKKGEDKYLNKLIGICQKYKNYCNFSYIYDSDDLLEMKDSPTDKGEDIFKELVNKRRIYK